MVGADGSNLSAPTTSEVTTGDHPHARKAHGALPDEGSALPTRASKVRRSVVPAVLVPYYVIALVARRRLALST